MAKWQIIIDIEGSEPTATQIAQAKVAAENAVVDVIPTVIMFINTKAHDTSEVFHG